MDLSRWVPRRRWWLIIIPLDFGLLLFWRFMPPAWPWSRVILWAVLWLLICYAFEVFTNVIPRR